VYSLRAVVISNTNLKTMALLTKDKDLHCKADASGSGRGLSCALLINTRAVLLHKCCVIFPVIQHSLCDVHFLALMFYKAASSAISGNVHVHWTNYAHLADRGSTHNSIEHHCSSRSFNW
jgi:hypothetical protein